jgi:hypothetical protein
LRIKLGVMQASVADTTSYNVAERPENPARRVIWWATGAILAALVFLPSLFAYFTGEDFIFIKFVADGKAFYDTSQNLFYRPLPNLLWQLDYSLWGLNAPGYHLTNILLHALNTALVALVASRLTDNRTIGWLASVFFGLHPLHVEPVTWLAGRPDLLATAFGLVALLAALQYFESRKTLWLILSLAAFGLGIFSKESVAGLPFVLAIWGFVLLKPRKFLHILLLIPFGLVMGAYLWLRVDALGSLGGYDTSGSLWLNALWNATVGLWLPLFFPFNAEVLGGIPALVLATLTLAVYVWLGWRTRSFWRTQRRLVFLLIVFIYGGVLPALPNAAVSPNLAQSRLLYLPSVAFCILLAAASYELRVTNRKEATSRELRAKTAFYSSIINHQSSIIVLFALGVVLALVPWLQGGALANSTFTQLRAAQLPLRAGDTLYYEGLPDNRQGAYIWRNGLDEATALLLAPGVRGVRRVDDVIVDYGRGRLWTARFAQQDADVRLIFSYSAETIQPGENPLGAFGQCDAAGWRWELSAGQFTCQDGRGFLLDTLSQKVSLEISSPQINESFRALEIVNYVYFDFSHPQVLCEVSLTDARGQVLFDQWFDFAANGKWQRYRLYLPPPPPDKFPVQLNVRVLKNRNNILWQNVGVVSRQ